jgi:hypothetical protein
MPERSVRLVATAVLATLATLAACQGKAAPVVAKAAPAALAPAPVATWANARVTSTLSLAGSEMTLRMSCCSKDGLAKITLQKVPRDTTVTVGRTSFQPKVLEGAEAAGMAFFDAEVTDAFAPVSLDLLRLEPKPPAPFAELDVPVTITLPRHEPVSTRFVGKVELEWSLYPTLAHIVSGPVKLASDADRPDAGAPDAAVILWEKESGFLSVHKRAPGLTVGDLDWIAVPTPVPSGKSRSCGGYAEIGGAPTHSVTFELDGLDVAVYERRTGTIVGKKSFAAPTDCPRMTTSGAKVLLPARELVDRWIEASLAAGKLAP